MKNKIAFISYHASPIASLGGTDSGGQNVYVAETALKLADLGYHIDIFTRRDSKELAQTFEMATRVRVINIDAGPCKKIPKECLFTHIEEFTNNIIEYMEGNQTLYKVIHAHFWMSGYTAIGIKRKFNVPFTITFHALGYIRKLHQKNADKFPENRMEVELKIIKNADKIVAECPEDRYNLISFYMADDSKIKIIPCGFNSDHFLPIYKEDAKTHLGVKPHQSIILQLGRIVPRKGIDNVIKAFSIVAEKDLNLFLYIVGGDLNDPVINQEISSLKKLASELGVSERVIFTGSKQREELKYYYSASECFISTPWYEPFGITPLEAMACGTPVIGSKVGGIKYTVKDQKTGFLVPPNNPEELADRISLLLENKEKQKEFSKAGIKRVYEHFTWEKVSLQLSNLYTEIISENEFLDEVLTFSICKTYKETFSTLLKSSKILIPHILKATQVITDALENGKKILICGNGGSASESQHFTAELIGRFQKPFRRALPAISLNADTSVITAWANDFDFSQIFSRQIEALGEKGDVLICLSTSGNSDNIIQAIKIANKKGITCLSLLGKDGGEAAKRSSVNIIIPSTDTARIQELHLNTIHVLCEAIEAKLFSSIPTDSETSEVVSIVNHQKLEQWKKEKLSS